ncbi:MAG: hypothetical protein HGB11_08955, partial [Chlorobiales bacterium]|nr:hypothetical protein [Chlorobiales bacterium]
MHDLLLLIHITCFALWMGAVAASLLVIRVFEPRLTGSGPNVAEDAALLKAYIRKETKMVDVVFIGAIVSGILLAQFYTGWTTWVFVKIGLLVLQFSATIGYVFKSVMHISYPCTPEVYKRWYKLIGISFTSFA